MRRTGIKKKGTHFWAPQAFATTARVLIARLTEYIIPREIRVVNSYIHRHNK